MKREIKQRQRVKCFSNVKICVESINHPDRKSKIFPRTEKTKQ